MFKFSEFGFSLGRQAVALVREFLEFFQLDFTTAVFDPETNAVRELSL